MNRLAPIFPAENHLSALLQGAVQKRLFFLWHLSVNSLLYVLFSEVRVECGASIDRREKRETRNKLNKSGIFRLRYV